MPEIIISVVGFITRHLCERSKFQIMYALNCCVALICQAMYFCHLPLHIEEWMGGGGGGYNQIYEVEACDIIVSLLLSCTTISNNRGINIVINIYTSIVNC